MTFQGDLVGETRSQAGDCRGSVLVRRWVALFWGCCLEDSTVRRRLLRESGPAPAVSTCTERYCGQHYPRAGRRPGAPIVASWAGGGGGVSVEVFMVYSQDSVLQRCVERIIDVNVGMEEVFKVLSQDGEWV